jgi:predicted DNA-binding transcriptional regulator YafY
MVRAREVNNRMKKLERLTGIFLILSRKGKVRAVDLADLYEVSERTIYRDVQALSELGVPVIAETGSGGDIL